MYLNLTPGRVYQIQTPDGEKTWGVYVRREEFPKSKTTWETFYRVVGNTHLPYHRTDTDIPGVLVRMRTPAKGTQVDKKGVLHTENLVTKIIQDPDNRPPSVQSWLEEVEKIHQDRLAHLFQ